MGTVGVHDLSSEIAKELSLYSSEITEKIKKTTKVHAKKLLDKTKATAPSGKRESNKYRNSIKCKPYKKTINGDSYLWYVDSKDNNYRLTHLIVHGHAKRGGGRTKSNDFLKKAVDEVKASYEKAIEEDIKYG